MKLRAANNTVTMTLLNLFMAFSLELTEPCANRTWPAHAPKMRRSKRDRSGAPHNPSTVASGTAGVPAALHRERANVSFGAYSGVMTKLLMQAFEKVQTLPPEMQDQAARMLLRYAGEDEPVIELTAEERSDLVEAQAEAARGEFATDAEVQAVFSKYRL